MVTVITKILDTVHSLKLQNLALFQRFDLPVSTGGMGKTAEHTLVGPLATASLSHYLLF